ncbi:MAG: hypothetical protein DMF62_17630 [Acidobacteria bacterium]|nr:MAG: hypothetical protein DMF62_17630 [Acidobacteriota bacterium]
MAVIFTKRLVMQHIWRRRVALICFVAGVLAVQVFRPPEDEKTSRFLVYTRPIPEKPEQDRDLSAYDLGGKVEECSSKEGSEMNQCLTSREKAREFIYNHWRSKTKGYIAVDFPCADCGPIVHIFIEPNEYGKWRVATRLEDGRFGLFQRDDAFDVKYKRANEIELRRESTNRVLTFVGKDGKEVRSF